MERVLQPVLAGIVSPIVGFAGSFPVVLTGLTSVGADPGQAASGLLAVSVASGLITVVLALRWRIPVSIAWSTPGAALLVAAGPQPGGFAAAVGAFLLCGVLIVVAGLVTPLGRLVGAIPGNLAGAMLAGVLLPLCLAPVQALAQIPLLAAPVIAVWALVARFARPWAVPSALVVALAGILWTGGLPAGAGVAPAFVWTTPAFDPATLVGIGLPLFVVTMVSQNVTGMAVLSQYGFRPPWRPVLLATGVGTIAAAPVGGHAVNLAAISAALVAGSDAGPAERRWIASTVSGAGLAALGLTAGIVTAVFAASPPVLVQAVAGLALLGALASSIAAAITEPDGREAAAVTFVVTAAGVSFLGLGAAFWGLLAGGAMTLLHRRRARPAGPRRISGGPISGSLPRTAR
ncbi:benzoate/H(+) symporter BenE family transporter [Pseudonocardia sp. TRM90224]|uniref:benzoate/H(+) symporter BenE family transporter n=1 Tax=Pseudonocardia sp. TRM90224 TaxID=2812678 RepID=UPI001E2D54D7|nr:benzoate/H(+) symporter BenE family transporter [Pseudonocardia sp. TRM90224]